MRHNTNVVYRFFITVNISFGNFQFILNLYRWWIAFLMTNLYTDHWFIPMFFMMNSLIGFFQFKKKKNNLTQQIGEILIPKMTRVCLLRSPLNKHLFGSISLRQIPLTALIYLIWWDRSIYLHTSYISQQKCVLFHQRKYWSWNYDTEVI